MELSALSEIMRRAGVVGAGGAGFPSYAKLNMAADTIILNCSECEPLLKLHRQLLARYTKEILSTLEEVADTLAADRVVIAVKEAYTDTVAALKAVAHKYKKVEIKELPEFYPAGDEVITIYETTGRVVAPGALPITVGCIVYNVETIYNVWRAWKENAPVTHKYITVAGEVKYPCTLKAPIGITYGELIKMAGGMTAKDAIVWVGGPMTGRISSTAEVVTKTSNAILVLPKSSYVVQKRLTPISIGVKRAMAACCQCRMCTDLCPRNQLGQPIAPHKIMNAVASGVSTDSSAFLGAFSCSSCGLCEMYSCRQGLNPTSMIAVTKNELRKNGIMPPRGLEPGRVEPTREWRRVPMSRLIATLGLGKYDVDAPIVDAEIKSRRLAIPLSQGIGAAAVATVAVGDTVVAGDEIGRFDPEKLGVAVHAPLGGRVLDVTEKSVVLGL